MSKEGEITPIIKINDKQIDSDDELDFEKKLEEMKAELQALESDFQTQNIDELVHKHIGPKSISLDPRLSGVDANLEELDNELDRISDLTPERRNSFLEVPADPNTPNDGNQSEGSILFGKEFLNNSQHTIRSIGRSSLFSNSHYKNFDPEGECLSEAADGEKNDEYWDLLEKDTLDLIKPSQIGRKSISKKSPKNMMAADEDEKKLNTDDIDDEWNKFLLEAKVEKPEEEFEEFNSKVNQNHERLRIQYYRNLVREDIMEITEKKQDVEVPALYAQPIVENRLIYEQELDKTGFNKDINEILNIEIILLILSHKSLHLSLSSDLEINRWKKFLVKFLKKNTTNHEGLFGFSQINFSIGLHELAVDY